MVALMASRISATVLPLSPSSSSATTRFAASTSSSSPISYPKTHRIPLSFCSSSLGLGFFSPWAGLKHLGISTRGGLKHLERRKKIPKGKAVFASLFGVGAPEALVIGVVALLVFGPKGLAEVARNLGKTLRAFQPTIKELQEVSREFKSSLEREIGLDEISSYNSTRSNAYSAPPSVPKQEDSLTVAEPTADGTAAASKAYSSEEYLKITQQQMKASAAAAAAQEQVPTAVESGTSEEESGSSAP